MRHALPRSRGSFLLGALVGALVLASPLLEQAAQAKKRVVVLAFSGPGGVRARKGVITALAKKVRFIKAGNFLEVGDQAGVDPTGAGLIPTCTKLRVDAVIKGRVKRKGRRYSIIVSVVNGGTGKREGRRAARVRGTRRLLRGGMAIGAQLLPVIRQTAYKKKRRRARPRRARPRRVVQPVPVPVYQPGATPAPRPRPVRKATRTRKARKQKKGGIQLDGLFDLSLSLGISMRAYHLAGADSKLDRRYDGGVYPEFTARLELYPMSLLMQNFARNIGLALSYTRHLAITTAMNTTKGEVEVDTGSQEFLLDLMLRWPILDRPTTPVILVSAGWGLRDFTLGENVILPTFKYRFVRFGVGGRVPLTTQLIALEVGFDLRPVMAVGQDAVDAFGEKDGGLGYALSGGVGGRTSFGLFYGLTFEYLRFGNDFLGRSDIQGSAPALVRKDATSGSDRFIRFWARVGYGM